MKHEDYKDYKAIQDERRRLAMSDTITSIMKQPGQISTKRFYALLQMLTPTTAAHIFWDAFEATQHVNHDITREYAKRIMMICDEFYNSSNLRLSSLRIEFHQTVNELSEQTLLEQVTMAELLTGRIYERIDNIGDY